MYLPEPNKAAGLDGLFNWVKRLVALPLLSGRLIEDIDVDTSGVVVNHRLGRAPRGVIVVKSSTTASYQTDDFSQYSFTITASAGTPQVSVWVF